MTNLTPTTETNKLKISKTITEEKLLDMEIDLPYYFTAYSTYFKIISEHQSVQVGIYGSNVSIQIRDSVTHQLSDSKTCTEEEFNTAFQIALSKIQNLSTNPLVERLVEQNIDLNILYKNILHEEKTNGRFEGMAGLIKKWIEENESVITKAQTL